MKQLYLLLAKNQKNIKKLFLFSYIILIAMFIIGIWQYDNSTDIKFLYKEIAKKSGQISVGLLILTLIPGMLKRIGILGKFESLLMLFRRQLGVLAFFTAGSHLVFVSWIKQIATGTNPLLRFFKYQQTGFAAITIFLLLWITSNDLSIKFLGKWWKYIQRLSYLSVIALILHIFDAGSKIWIVLSVILTVEALSWFIFLIKSKMRK
jgi:methionine sulfoxide reductase heme-binding subunit